MRRGVLRVSCPPRRWKKNNLWHTRGTLKPVLSARVFFSYSPIDNELIGKQ